MFDGTALPPVARPLPTFLLWRSVYSVAKWWINRFIPARAVPVAIEEGQRRAMWSDPERGIGGIAVEGSDHVVSVRSSETDGGGMQSLRPRDRVCLTVHHGLSGCPSHAGVNAVTGDLASDVLGDV